MRSRLLNECVADRGSGDGVKILDDHHFAHVSIDDGYVMIGVSERKKRRYSTLAFSPKAAREIGEALIGCADTLTPAMKDGNNEPG